jgi:hypothetical protein
MKVVKDIFRLWIEYLICGKACWYLVLKYLSYNFQKLLVLEKNQTNLNSENYTLYFLAWYIWWSLFDKYTNIIFFRLRESWILRPENGVETTREEPFDSIQVICNSFTFRPGFDLISFNPGFKSFTLNQDYLGASRSAWFSHKVIKLQKSHKQIWNLLKICNLMVC